MSHTTSHRSIAVVVADLIFGVRVRGAAEHAGVHASFARNADELQRAAAAADFIILDLDARWLNADTIRALRADEHTRDKPIIAFVAHTRTDAIQAARDAGADQVLARSAFVRVLPSLLRGERT